MEQNESDSNRSATLLGAVPMASVAMSLKMMIVTAVMSALASPFAMASSDIPGYPERIHAYDSREVAMLPEYCMYTQLFRDRVPGGKNPGEIARWKASFGDTFNAMHHYCWGLMMTNRALYLARSKGTREHYLAASINEFDYVLERAPIEFPLLPEILTKKGENLLKLDRGTQGIQALETAINVKTDYWPPYAALSDYYKFAGDAGRARDWLEKGLSVAPAAKPLKERLLRLETRKARPAKSGPGGPQ
jgi:hypothetical protein